MKNASLAFILNYVFMFESFGIRWRVLSWQIDNFPGNKSGMNFPAAEKNVSNKVQRSRSWSQNLDLFWNFFHLGFGGFIIYLIADHLPHFSTLKKIAEDPRIVFVAQTRIKLCLKHSQSQKNFNSSHDLAQVTWTAFLLRTQATELFSFLIQFIIHSRLRQRQAVLIALRAFRFFSILRKEFFSHNFCFFDSL